MKRDAIAEIGIDDSGRLYVRPASESLPYIYREAIEVHWNDEKRYLYSPKPREWTYFDWFRHIIGAAELQSVSLGLTASTIWSRIPEDVKGAIQKWMLERTT